MTKEELIRKENNIKNYVLDLLFNNEDLCHWIPNKYMLHYWIPQEDEKFFPFTIEEFLNIITIWICTPVLNFGDTSYRYLGNIKINKEEDKRYDYLSLLIKKKKNEIQILEKQFDKLDKIEIELKKIDITLKRKIKLKNL